MVWGCYGIPFFHFYFILFFLFRTDGEKGHLDENDFHHCYHNILKVSYWKLLDRSSVSTITSKINSSILKHVWQVKSLQTRINVRANIFWVIIMKRISAKVTAELSLAGKARAVLQRTFHQYGRWHFTHFYTPLFLSKKPNF